MAEPNTFTLVWDQKFHHLQRRKPQYHVSYLFKRTRFVRISTVDELVYVYTSPISPASCKLIGNETSDSLREISFHGEFLSLISKDLSHHIYLWRKWLFWLLIKTGMLSTRVLLGTDTVHVLRTVRHCTTVRRELLGRKPARIWQKILHSTLDWSIKWRVPVFSVTVVSDRLSKRIFKPQNIRHTFGQSSEDVDSSSFTRLVKRCTGKQTPNR